jgi:hypothetical protein
MVELIPCSSDFAALGHLRAAALGLGRGGGLMIPLGSVGTLDKLDRDGELNWFHYWPSSWSRTRAKDPIR